MTPDQIESLISAASGAAKRAIAGCSGFKVGAALMDETGAVYSGCNVENPSLMLTICAERVALYKALSEGARSFRAIAIVSEDGRYCFPCGTCRQALSEFSPGIDVYLNSKEGVKKYSLSELLPHPFER